MPTIEELRKARGWSYERAAAASGMRVTASTFRRVELGHVRPETRTKDDIAAAFGLTADEIEWPEFVGRPAKDHSSDAH